MSKRRIAGLALCLAACSLEGRSTARLEAEPSRGPGSASTAGSAGAAQDAELQAFASRVVLDADQSWAGDFRRRKKPYQAAHAVTFSARAPNPCARVGLVPAGDECQEKGAVYVDLDFQRALQRRYPDEAAAPQAYAIAHAMGHHVQKVLGLDTKAAGLVRERPVAAHSVELQLELQADCLAGVWARVSKSGLLPRERVEEALRQASDVGTQRRLEQEARPLETFTYAIPRRRLYWFAKGYGTAKLEDCDPFANE
jgi:predicted metalloprotease